jgi:hypothetical protein
VQQKSGLKNLVLERKLEAVGDQLEKKEAQLGEVLSASNLDPGTLQQVTKKLDEVLDSKNQLIKVGAVYSCCICKAAELNLVVYLTMRSVVLVIQPLNPLKPE